MRAVEVANGDGALGSKLSHQSWRDVVGRRFTLSIHLKSSSSLAVAWREREGRSAGNSVEWREWIYVYETTGDDVRTALNWL